MRKILGVETSCDDTCIGLIHGDNIIKNIRISQEKNYNLYGGIVPEVSARSHLFNIENAMNKIEDLNHIDQIAVTMGPGMIGPLTVGYHFAKGLSNQLKIPLIPVHHLAGHIVSARNHGRFLALLISGGHSSIILCNFEGHKDHKIFQTLSSTRDDAVGELFDKIGRSLHMSFPAGPQIEKLALNAIIKHKVQVPLLGSIDFSFSGLKTFFLQCNWAPEEIAWSLQDVVARTMSYKLKMARSLTGINEVAICGGVACNNYIREHLKEKLLEIGFTAIDFAPQELCQDNGVMIAMAAYYLPNLYKGIDVFDKMPLENFYI